jgi:hypothetical protein
LNTLTGLTETQKLEVLIWMISAIHTGKRRYLEQPVAEFCACGLPRIPEQHSQKPRPATGAARGGAPKNEASSCVPGRFPNRPKQFTLRDMSEAGSRLE